MAIDIYYVAIGYAYNIQLKNKYNSIDIATVTNTISMLNATVTSLIQQM